MRQLVILLLLSLQSAPPVTVFLIGDSTMADKPLVDNPERGWGMRLNEFLRPEIRVENHARNGRSTRTFISEHRWDSVRTRLKPGDVVVIQFGHNDQSHEKVDRYTPPDQFRANLVRFIEETRAAGAQPILCTPIVRRRFDSTGTFFDVHGEYPDLTREVARTHSVPLVDMHRSSERLLRDLGAVGSRQLFLHIPPGIYASLPDGRRDDTHFSEFGAATVARLFADGLRVADPALAALVLR
ncbi:MAG: rhamnogalacturonan acetylesterase [Bacteroidetes bacterium]|jgi:lysophospholipase L1-like esterase|nr:rhamnogalacturonan acetylesterase [Bacteroidota bacterium]